ncbi:MAG: phage tail protein [Bacteroidota bacterium]
MSEHSPPASFYFLATIDDEEKPAAFQEVSGIMAKMEISEISEGGENRFVHRVPGRVRYDNLVLKRSMIQIHSAFYQWCYQSLNGSPSQRIEPKSLRVDLIDAQLENNKVLRRWVFENAYPTKWEVGQSSADEEQIIESLEFAYTHFQQISTPIQPILDS